MENKNKTLEQSNETNILDATVGENEGNVALDPKDVMIASITEQTHNKDDKKMENSLIHIHVKHPDKDELISIKQIKWLNGEKMVNSALFASLDSDGKFMKDSAIARLLAFVSVNTLKELEGKTIGTVKEAENSKYLSLKCYQ